MSTNYVTAEGARSFKVLGKRFICGRGGRKKVYRFLPDIIYGSSPSTRLFRVQDATYFRSRHVVSLLVQIGFILLTKYICRVRVGYVHI